MNAHRAGVGLVCVLLTATACANNSVASPTAGATPRPVATNAATNAATTPPASASMPSKPKKPIRSRYAATTRTPWGTTSTTRYSPNGSRFAERPYTFADGAGAGTGGGVAYIGYNDVDELVASARLVVRGTVDAIGRPHFNSDNGGFWHPDLVERKCCETAGPTVRRDVTVRVSETWGRRDVPPIGGSVTFSATGGQIQVILSPEVQRKLGMTPAERYIWADEPGVDFAVGDDLLFLLDVEGIDGLYHGRLGEMRAYVPAAHNAYVYRITGDTAVNVGYPGLDAPVGRLRAVVDRSLGTRAGELPPEGFTPSEPHSD